jgi:hypothetical protein
MGQALETRRSSDPSTDAHRQAYNAAFEELGLNWHWDPVTYACLPAQGREGVCAYLQAEHPHLLRAYDAQFLADAIEAAKARFYAAMTRNRSAAKWYLGRTQSATAQPIA